MAPARGELAGPRIEEPEKLIMIRPRQFPQSGSTRITGEKSCAIDAGIEEPVMTT